MWFKFFFFGLKFFITWLRNSFPFFEELFFFLLSNLLFCLRYIFQVISKCCTKRWIFSRIISRTLTIHSASFDIHQRFLYREHMCFFIEEFFTYFAQRGIIIKYVKSSSESSKNEIVLPFLNYHITNGISWNSRFKLNPLFTRVGAKENSKFGACKQQIWINKILFD